MFARLSHAFSHGIVNAGATLLGKAKDDRMITALVHEAPVPPPSPLATQVKQLTTTVATTVATTLTAADERYQQFMQTHIDPLLGKTRHAQMQEILHESALTLTPEERFANRRIALGGLALGTALAGQFLYPPLTFVAILLGLSTIWTIYYWAYLEWQRTKRIGAVHLTCLYVAFLWCGGYASIGALGSFLLGIALKVKAITENQSRNNLINVFQLQPSKVWIRSQDAEIEIPFAQLKVGDTLVLSAGQIVPVDGVIVAGIATVDQHMLTGEAQPVEKVVGDAVLASTVVISGKVDVQVQKTGADTTAGQIGAILNQTAQHNTALGLKVIELTDRFAVPTLALSAASLPFIGPAGAVSLLGANTTFTTYTSGPLATLNFLNIAARGGILVKDGGALERLTSVDTIVFDKTGTLTLEQPQVAQIHTVNGGSEAEILTLAAAAEARQTHPIARAILAAAAAHDLTLPAIEQAHYEVGFGIKVRLATDESGAEERREGERERGDKETGDKERGERETGDRETGDRETGDGETGDGEIGAEGDGLLVRVGSVRFMAMEGVALPATVEAVITACQVQGHSLVLVALGDQLVGCIELQPTVRPEAKRIVDGLRERGLALYIISGDQEAPTRKLALELGMTGYFANTLPEQKATLVAKLQQQGRQVCFIGDGINDAIAMRKAYVSISLRGATTAATDTAQIILMEGNLNQLLHLFALAQEFAGNLKRNLQLTTTLSLVAVGGIFFAGFTFAATEIFYTVSLLGGLGIAMQPLLTYQRQAQPSRVGLVEATATPSLPE